MIGLVAVAFADAPALRIPHAERAVVTTIGVPASAAGAWLGPGLALAVEVAGPADALGLLAGTERRRGEGPVAVAVGVSGGPTWLSLDPGWGLSASGWARAEGSPGPVDLGMGLVVPAAVRVGPDPGWRLPVQVEPWFGVNLGDLRVGVGGALGVAWSGGQAPAAVLGAHAGLAVAY